jgi:hypothetical protein
MACSTCNKKKNINLKQSLSSDANESFSEILSKGESVDAVFSGKIGKFAFFMILLICAITPIVNIAAVYMFYIAVYGKNTKKSKNVTKHTNTDETE